MTLAAVAPVSSNQTAIWVVIAIVATFAIGAVLYQHERRADRHGNTLAEHTEQLATLAYQMPALLDWLRIEIPAPEVDDSPAAEDVATYKSAEEIHRFEPDDDAKTDEFPACPPTQPDGIAIQVQSALIEQRPSPVPRGKSAEWVEDAIEAMRARNAERMARAEEAS